MAIEQLMKDVIAVVKKDGTRYDNIKASVQTDKVFTTAATIPIEEGDVYERTLPSGVVERYLVLDAGFYSGLGGLPGHYQSSVRKTTIPEPQRPPAKAKPQIVYNLTGANARVNIQSIDGSSNVVGIPSEELFAELRNVIRGAALDEEQSAKLDRLVSELEEVRSDKSGFAAKYGELISAAADHIALLAPFLPALSQMLA